MLGRKIVKSVREREKIQMNQVLVNLMTTEEQSSAYPGTLRGLKEGCFKGTKKM